MKNIKKHILLLAFILTAIATKTYAVRPFITDDAALSGFKRSELSSWIFASKAGTEVWHSANWGLTHWAELTVAGIWGRSKYDFKGETFEESSYTLPLLQGKFLFRDYEPNGLPGVVIAVGADMPWGKGAFVADGYTAFGAALFTQCFGNDEKYLGAKIGCIGILHTWGQTVDLHPHIHYIVPAGGIDETGNWRHTRSDGKYLFPVRAMSTVFRGKFVALLKAFLQAKGIEFSEELRQDIYKKEWVVYAKRPFGEQVR
jgi:hypothetical protein